MNESFSALVESTSSILVVLPNKPYFDQVAAGLSLYLSLRDKKPTAIFSPSPMTVEFNRLIGVNKVGQELGNKNLVISFPNYEAGNIEKVSYDIEESQFKLTVAPKEGLMAPNKDQVEIGHAGGSADLVILIGGANDSHFPTLSDKNLEGARVAHVGTRVLATTKSVMSFAKPGSSASELVASLIKENQLPMDSDCATNLVMGIEEGSNHFESPEVTPESFEVFAYLLRNGGRRLPKGGLEPKNFPPGSIPTQPFSVPVPDKQPEPVQQEAILEQVETKEEVVENPPQDWLQPKIYKGTSVS